MGRPDLLMVDDNHDMATVLSKAAATCGFEARVTHTAHDSLQAYDGSVPALIMVDLAMPDMDGVELLRYRHMRDMAHRRRDHWHRFVWLPREICRSLFTVARIPCLICNPPFCRSFAKAGRYGGDPAVPGQHRARARAEQSGVKSIPELRGWTVLHSVFQTAIVAALEMADLLVLLVTRDESRSPSQLA
jgi:hypothetical protein